MTTLSALMVVRNEEDVIGGCLDLLEPYVDEIIVVDMQSQDRTAEIVKKYNKVKYYSYRYNEPLNMGAARSFSLEKATGDWFLQVDADEYYPKESLEEIRIFINNPGNNISLRINYYNVAWRYGYIQDEFEHYPDRLYRRDVVEKYFGILPLDMTIVKNKYRNVEFKKKGIEGVLEYDNIEDKSFEHPRQPIRKDIVFYHLARARGFNFEYEKRLKYEKFIHPNNTTGDNERNTRWNQWVSGMYAIKKHNFPPEIPKQVIPNPKVSVVLTCFNKEKYIGDTLESVLNQTKAPHEVIIVDDGSTDKSRSIIDTYPVSAIYQENRGVALARNRGLDNATGDYFILMDGDDKLVPAYIERTLSKMKGDIQVVWTDFLGLDEWKGMHHRYSGNIEDLRTAQCIPSVMALCDMRILDRYGNFKPEAHYEDYEFWLNVYFNRKMNFVHIPEPLCYYRRNQGSRIDTLDQKKKEGYDQLREWYKEFNVNPK